ncbi:MAG: TetR/AcrR family transcriptional regulator [Oscillospiraceae bacterium]|nr:TetR/AcrR family transcriptional regulator [Oscillospiraceae bacterium]
MGRKEDDRRVRRTRALLRQSLTGLLQEKSLREITVKELTERADVNRGTFYSHYEDLNDMMAQLENELFEEFEQVITAYPARVLQKGIQPILRDAFCFIARNADLCATLLRDKDSTFLERLKVMVYRQVEAEWGALHQFPDENVQRRALAFFVGGVVGIVQSWAESGWQDTPEELALLADQLMMKGLGESI